MASVFSSYVPPVLGFSYYDCHLTPSRRSAHTPSHISDSGPRRNQRNAPVPVRVTRLHSVAVHLLLEPRRISPPSPRGNQGGFYDVRQEIAPGCSHAPSRIEHGLFSVPDPVEG
jgi:hypothetical protein